MEQSTLALTNAFMLQYPQVVAGILETQPIQSTASLLAELPFDTNIKILSQMMPHYTAKLYKFLTIDDFIEKISALDLTLITAILRQLKASERRILIAKLPIKNQITCKLLLNFYEDMVGAWMQPDILMLPDDCTIEKALQRIRICEKRQLINPMYIINRNRQLVGKIQVFQLIQLHADSHISTHMEKCPEPITGRCSLHIAQKNQGWDNNTALPIINHANEAIGVLTYSSLLTGLNKIAETAIVDEEIRILNNVLSVYGDLLTTLASRLVNSKNDAASKSGG